MGRKYFFIVLGLCLAITWANDEFAQQYRKFNRLQKSLVLEATLDFEENGDIYNLLEKGSAKLKNAILSRWLLAIKRQANGTSCFRYTDLLQHCVSIGMSPMYEAR
jgi:hypothetical protein